MGFLFTSESVSEGHPDKVCDQVSDAILDAYLRQDPTSKVACETLTTTGLVVISGEVKSSSVFDHQQVIRDVINDIGYTKSEYKFDGESCSILSAIHGQSPDINQGVEEGKGLFKEQGAGDQGMMFGFACVETDNYMPATLEISHVLLQELAAIRKEMKQMTYLRPDSKSQVTIEYDQKTKQPLKIDTIVLSTQHDDFDKNDDVMLAKIKDDVAKILIPRAMKRLPSRLNKLFDGNNFKLLVNPTGKFVIGGPHGDTGLTGRKIIVDTYGGRGAHGGGAFSGKDSSKVDRSAAYATRHIAKNIVAAGVATECLVQVAYAIGVAEPVGLYVNTYGTCSLKNSNGEPVSDVEISDIVKQLFDLKPAAIVSRFGLRNPIFLATASYGHFGRNSYSKKVSVIENGKEVEKEVEFFTWEKLDYVDKLKAAFKIA
ncbi:MAG: methionine adenosyltransferase [Bacteroidales bacterium]|nr:methionine adenosyltransferase [Bacteroidales bacterium]